jgi:hypothetical protein
VSSFEASRIHECFFQLEELNNEILRIDNMCQRLDSQSGKMAALTQSLKIAQQTYQKVRSGSLQK